MNIVVERNDTETQVNCIFCGKDLAPSDDKVRYRGAISCRECAEKQESTSSPMMKPFVYLAGIGCIIGMLTFVGFGIHGLLFASTDYIQPVGSFFAGMTVALVTISFGLYVINRNYLLVGSFIGMLTALVTAIVSGLAVLDFVTNGPYYTINDAIYTKTLSYYSTAVGTISLFCLVTALAILMHMTNTRTDNVSIASAGMMFVSAGIALYSWTWFLPSFITAFAFALTFIFFVSRKQISEEEDIQPLSSLNG